MENYLLWKAQIVPFLKGHQLFGYVDYTIPMPLPMVDNAVNPEYTKWALQDQLIVSTINASLSDTMLAQVLTCTTSSRIWNTLEKLFAAQSSAHVMKTKLQIAALKKGSATITEYFQKVTTLAATLSAAD